MPTISQLVCEAENEPTAHEALTIVLFSSSAVFRLTERYIILHYITLHYTTLHYLDDRVFRLLPKLEHERTPRAQHFHVAAAVALHRAHALEELCNVM